jgi:hypothetical protein
MALKHLPLPRKRILGVSFDQERVTAGSVVAGDHIMMPDRPTMVMRVEEVIHYKNTVTIRGVLTNGSKQMFNRFRIGPIHRVVWHNEEFKARLDAIIDAGVKGE